MCFWFAEYTASLVSGDTYVNGAIATAASRGIPMLLLVVMVTPHRMRQAFAVMPALPLVISRSLLVKAASSDWAHLKEVTTGESLIEQATVEVSYG